MKKILLSVLLLGLLLLGLLVALPRLLSTTAGTRWLVRRLNSTLQGNLGMERCRLRWAAPSSLRGITWEDDDGSAFQVEEMRLAHGLLRAATQRDPGEIFLLRPALTLNLPAPAPPEVTPPPTPPTTPPPPGPPVPAPIPPEALEPLPWPVLFSGSLKVIEGRVTVLQEGKRLLALEELYMDLALASVEEGVRWRMDFAQADAAGNARASGMLRPGPERNLHPETLTGEAQVVIEGWDLGTLLNALELPDGLRASGILETDLRAHSAAGAPLRVQGTARVSRAEASGGLLTTDRLTAERIDLQADLAFPLADGYTQRLTCDTGFFRLRLEGHLAERQRPAAEIELDIDLADLAGQLPRTLQLRDGLLVDEGRLQARLRLSPAETGLRVQGEMRLEDLAGRHEELILTLREPFHLSGEVALVAESWELRTLEMQSAFVRGSATGSAEAIEARLAFDIAALLEEAGQFFDLSLWQGTGTLDLQARGSNLRAETPRLAAVFKGSEVTVEHAGKAWLDREALHLEAEILLQNTPAAMPEFSELQLSYRLPASEGMLSATGITFAATGPRVQTFDLRSSADLERLAPWLDLEGLDAMAGRTELRLAGALGADALRLDSFTFTGEGVQLRGAQGALRLAGLQAAGEGLFSRDPEGAFMLRTEAGSDFGTLSLALRRPEPDPRGAAWEAELRAGLDIAQMLQSAAGTPGLPAPGAAAGQVTFHWNLTPTPEGLARHTMDLLLTALQVTHEDTRHDLGDGEATLQALYDQGADRIDLSEMRWQSSLLSGNAQGSLTEITQDQVLQLQGELQAREEDLAAWITRWTGERVLIEGLSPLPFKGRLALGVAFDSALRDALLNFKVSSERLEFQDVELSAVTLAATTHDGLLQGQMAAVMEDGRLSLAPELALTETPPVLRLPDESRVLEDLHLSPALAERLLADWHPLFRDNRVEDGRLGLFFKSFRTSGVDAQGTLDLDFDGRLELRDVHLTAEGWLEELLDQAKIRERTITIEKEDIHVVASEGRMHCSPLSIQAGSVKLSLQGSVGFDRSLDYVVRIPVTQELVGREAYPFLRDTTLEIPIRGTIDRPQFDPRDLQAATAALLRQAARRAIERKAGELLRR